MNVIMMLLMAGAGAYVLINKERFFGDGGSNESGSPLSSSGVPQTGLTTAGAAVPGTSSIPAGATVNTVQTEVLAVPPGGTTPIAQTTTAVLVNHDPGRPVPGSVLITPEDLQRQQGNYVPQALTSSERAILSDLLAAYRGDERTVLGMLANGQAFDYSGSFSRTVPDWNSWAQMGGSGSSLVTEAQAGGRWLSRMNQEEYLGLKNGTLTAGGGRERGWG